MKKKSDKNVFVKAKDKFMSLSKKVKIVIGLWLVLLIVLLVLVLGSNSNKKKLDEYAKMEQNLTNATLNYMKNSELYPNSSNKLKVDLTMLREQKIISDDVVPDKTCRGYSLVYYMEEEEKYSVESFLNCKNYTTKDYFVNLD